MAVYHVRFTVTPNLIYFRRPQNDGYCRDIVPVIKELRYFLGLSLKASKDIVESMLDSNHITRKVNVLIENQEEVLGLLARRVEDILSERHGINHNVLKGEFITVDGLVTEIARPDLTVIIK